MNRRFTFDHVFEPDEPNGAVYEGQFDNGKKTGRAKFTDPSGVVYEGEFVDGQPIQNRFNLRSEVPATSE